MQRTVLVSAAQGVFSFRIMEFTQLINGMGKRPLPGRQGKVRRRSRAASSHSQLKAVTALPARFRPLSSLLLYTHDTA